jgi:TRAP-type mannitol/chloroaromatic compound transport system permease small subunit
MYLGNIAAICSLVMALVTALVVIWRYAFDGGSLALQESINYLYASIFMLGAALTVQRQGHVRVDIFYHRFSTRTKAWINSIGAIVFLLPLSACIAWLSVDYVAAAWSVRERSADPGGLAAVYLLKTLIPLMATSVFLQGCAELLRNLILLSTPNPTNTRLSSD